MTGPVDGIPLLSWQKFKEQARIRYLNAEELRNPDQLRGRDRYAVLYAERVPFSVYYKTPR